MSKSLLPLRVASYFQVDQFSREVRIAEVWIDGKWMARDERVSANNLRKLRIIGAEVIAFAYHDRVADFRPREIMEF